MHTNTYFLYQFPFFCSFNFSKCHLASYGFPSCANDAYFFTIIFANHKFSTVKYMLNWLTLYWQIYTSATHFTFLNTKFYLILNLLSTFSIESVKSSWIEIANKNLLNQIKMRIIIQKLWCLTTKAIFSKSSHLSSLKNCFNVSMYLLLWNSTSSRIDPG